MSEPTLDKARVDTSRRVVRMLREDPLFAAFVKEKSEGAGSLLMALPTDTMSTILAWVAEVEAPAIVCFEEKPETDETLSVLVFHENSGGIPRDIQEVVRVAPTTAIGMLWTYARSRGRVSVHLAEPDFTVYVPDAMATL